MFAFKLLLVTVVVGVGAYTLPVILDDGLGALFPTFFGDMAAMQGGYELLEHVPEQPERARLFGTE